MTPPEPTARRAILPQLVLVGLGLFALGCAVNVGLPLLAGRAADASILTPHSLRLALAQTGLNTLLLVACARASLLVGWRATRLFWRVAVIFILLYWLAHRIAPLVLADDSAVRLVVRYLPTVFLLGVFFWLGAIRPASESELLRPIAVLVAGCGWASTVAAIALPIRVGLSFYDTELPAASIPKAERVQHVPAPAEYAELANPLENPQFCVVLEEVGPNPDAVLAIVQQAVPNRTAQWARELAATLPRTIRESADSETAREIAGKLRETGATCSVRDALELFVEAAAADRDTPIGKSSQVLDDRFLATGRDAIAELRSAIARSDQEPLTPAPLPASRERGAREGESGIREERDSLRDRERTKAPLSPLAGRGAGGEGLELRVDRELARQAFVALATAEGRALYQINCRPCHGTKGSGDGPMAAAFTLRPVNFRDPETLVALGPGEVLWRIEHGSRGLPPEATPWDSSMPAWKHELDRELVWKIILGLFNTANVRPQASAGHQHARPARAAAGPAGWQLPEKTWLEWPVPAKPSNEQMREPEFVTRGKYHYYWRCMPCHGVTGRGDGPAANTMWPRPRDFGDTEDDFGQKRQPKFKFRTTKNGWLPTDEDLYRTISRGLVGTAMEGWSDVLQPEEVWQVIAYLKTFSIAWNDPNHESRNPYDPVTVQEFAKDFPDVPNWTPVFDFAALRPPRVTRELLREGEETYRRQGCWQCHGMEARGDGPALGQHHDDWGYRAWPQNLSNPFNFKAGHSLREIHRTFTVSLDGTVMPQFPASQLDPTDPARGETLQWALAAYVHSLVAQPRRTEQSNLIVARRQSGELPTDPLDPRWARLPGAVVPLTGQVLVAPRWPTPSVTQVAIKSVFNADSLAVWLRWDDRRPNVTHQDVPEGLEPVERHPVGPKTYAFPSLKQKAPVLFDARDQIELQWPTQFDRGPEPAFFLYGDEQNPVLLWRWLADRQGLEVTKEVVRIGGTQGERVTCSVPDETAGHDAVVELMARGSDDTASRLAADSSAVRSRAHWANGAWTAVLTRSLLTDRSGDVQFAEAAAGRGSRPVRQPVPLAVHVWDGAAGESDTRMALSSWCYLVFELPRPAWVHVAAVVAALITLAAELGLARWYRRRVAGS